MRKKVVMWAGFLLVAFGGFWAILGAIGVPAGSSTASVSPWSKVDSCLEHHASFAGNVAVGKGRGNGAVDSTSVWDSRGTLAWGFRYRTPSAARAAERGIGPPLGPTVIFYGNVALQINRSIPPGAASAIQSCFDSIYGEGAGSPLSAAASQSP